MKKYIIWHCIQHSQLCLKHTSMRRTSKIGTLRFDNGEAVKTSLKPWLRFLSNSFPIIPTRSEWKLSWSWRGRTASQIKKMTAKLDAGAELLVCLLQPLPAWRSRCRLRHSIVTSLIWDLGSFLFFSYFLELKDTSLRRTSTQYLSEAHQGSCTDPKLWKH